MKAMRWVLLWLLALVLFSPLFVIEVRAQTPVPTDTSTPTYAPLFPTGTPQPTRSYDCPLDLPTGWGTATPQGWWSMSCSKCLLALTPTSTPQPTYTPFGAPTSDPNVTPTATFTATATPDPVSVWYEPIVAGSLDVSAAAPFNSNVTNTVVGSFSRMSTGPIIALEYSYIVFFPAFMNSPASTANVSIGVGGSYPILTGGTTLSHSVSGTQVSSPVIHIPAYSSGAWSTGGMGGSASVWGSQAVYNAWLSERGRTVVNNFATPLTGSSFSLSASANTAAFFETGTTNLSIQVTGIWYYGEELDASPPLNPDFCAAVNDGQLDAGPVDIGIELPNIMVGSPRCYGFGGLETSIGDWDINMPPLQLCMKPVQFGQFDLFGLVISIDGLLATMAGILLVRWVLRS